MLGGPLGALFGAALGHNFDSGFGALNAGGGYFEDVEKIQTAFFTATFSMMGHIAKSDGQVSQDEINVAQHIMRQMNLNPEQRKVAQKLFREGKKADYPVNDVLHQFRMVCHRRRNLMQMFLEILVVTALSDGRLESSESRILENTAQVLGFSRQEYEGILSRMRAQQHNLGRQDAGMSLSDAYRLLGIEPGASDQEVKKAYRRQMNQHHPDKLVSKGLPREMMELANRKAQDIKSAYELIKKSRKN